MLRAEFYIPDTTDEPLCTRLNIHVHVHYYYPIIVPIMYMYMHMYVTGYMYLTIKYY